MPDFFDVESFHVGVERKIVAPGALFGVAGGGEDPHRRRALISAAEGNGPVNALDLALRKDLGTYQRHIESMELRDYRVRVFQGGTDAVTRVLIEFGDGGRAPGRRSASRATSSTRRFRRWSTASSTGW